MNHGLTLSRCPAILLVLFMYGCQADKTVEQAATVASHQLSTYRAELDAKVAVETNYYTTAAADLLRSAPTAQFVDFDDALTQSARAFVLDFESKRPSFLVLEGQLAPTAITFATTWSKEDATRQSAYADALSTLQHNHDAVQVAEQKIISLSSKLRTLSLPYSNGEIFSLLVGVAQKVKIELDQQQAADTTAAVKAAKQPSSPPASTPASATPPVKATTK